MRPANKELDTLLGAMVTTLKISPEPPELLPALKLLKEAADCQDLLPLLEFLEDEMERKEQSSPCPLGQFRMELGLNSLTLEVFSRVGALDLAEKQELKQRYGREEVVEAGGRLRAREVFSLHLGGSWASSQRYSG